MLAGLNAITYHGTAGSEPTSVIENVQDFDEKLQRGAATTFNRSTTGFEEVVTALGEGSCDLTITYGAGLQVGLAAVSTYGTAGAPPATPITGVRNVKWGIKTDTAKSSDRDSDWTQKLPAKRKATTSFGITWDATDTSLVALKAAFDARTEISLGHKNATGGSGITGDCFVSGFDHSQPLEDGMSVEVTVEFNGKPTLVVSAGTGQAAIQNACLNGTLIALGHRDETNGYGRWADCVVSFDCDWPLDGEWTMSVSAEYAEEPTELIPTP